MCVDLAQETSHLSSFVSHGSGAGPLSVTSFLSVGMATMDQFQQLLHRNGEWMRQMQEQQMLQMKAMLDQIVANLPSGMGTQMHIKELDERNFRDLGKFEGRTIIGRSGR